MKFCRRLFSLIVMAAVLLAVSLSAFAIGFDAETVYGSVFVVYSGISAGSGFAVGGKYIATNAHVLNDPGNVVIKTYSGEEYTAVTVGIDQEQDIAVLSVEGMDFPALTMADSASVGIGDDIYTIGAPKSMEYTLTKGVISAQDRVIEDKEYIQIDAAVNEGNSGGPLLNDSGQVLGMITLKMSDSEGIGLAIPSETLKSYFSSLGLNVDEEGRVSGEAAAAASPQTTDQAPEQSQAAGGSENGGAESSEGNVSASTLFIAICCIAAVSLAGNIVLIIALVYQKNKNLKLKYDPSERTDFEIDILE